MTKSSGSAKIAWRFECDSRCLKSNAELGRLRTLAKALNWLALKSSTSFPWPKVPMCARTGVSEEGGKRRRVEQRPR